MPRPYAWLSPARRLSAVAMGSCPCGNPAAQQTRATAWRRFPCAPRRRARPALGQGFPRTSHARPAARHPRWPRTVSEASAGRPTSRSRAASWRLRPSAHGAAEARASRGASGRRRPSARRPCGSPPSLPAIGPMSSWRRGLTRRPPPSAAGAATAASEATPGRRLRQSPGTETRRGCQPRREGVCGRQARRHWRLRMRSGQGWARERRSWRRRRRWRIAAAIDPAPQSGRRLRRQAVRAPRKLPPQRRRERTRRLKALPLPQTAGAARSLLRPPAWCGRASDALGSDPPTRPARRRSAAAIAPAAEQQQQRQAPLPLRSGRLCRRSPPRACCSAGPAGSAQLPAGGPGSPSQTLSAALAAEAQAAAAAGSGERAGRGSRGSAGRSRLLRRAPEATAGSGAEAPGAPAPPGATEAAAAGAATARRRSRRRALGPKTGTAPSRATTGAASQSPPPPWHPRTGPPERDGRPGREA